ncbi:cysteine hydrolase family protein [Roseomonas rosulenta]|uniref:cysteine hydrolase family protein n=1 Tax=Roseomonas rosulenta TaxID=2748667 RepID=UPI0018DF1D27|nr:cysteine hydrolase family protein [Roseomonas rosulenta]
MTTLPQTLLAMTGAPTHPAPLDRAVLVVIDVQREYRDGRLPLAGVDAATEEAGRLLALARARGVPVIHIVQHSPPGRGVFDETGPMVAILPAVAPLPGEPIIPKRLPNAFAGTDLADRIRALGRSEVILAGFMTHMCISATARCALDLGVRATVVAGATATRDLPDPLGGVIPAATVHRTALAELADRFATVVPDTAALAASAREAAA